MTIGLYDLCNGLATATATASRAGLCPQLSGSTDHFLRADGTWAAPAGGPGGQAFPVGSVFVSVVETNPATLLGYGSWEAIAAGRVLVGLDGTNVDFNAAEKTGGALTVASNVAVADHASHTHDYSGVISHTHAVNVTDPGHTHGQRVRSNNTAGTAGTQGASAADATTIGVTASGTTGISATTSAPAGSGASATTTGPSAPLTHAVTNNPTSVVQPYFVVYMWKRIA